LGEPVVRQSSGLIEDYVETYLINNPDDYDKIQEDDTFQITGLTEFAPGKPLSVFLNHIEGTTDQIKVNHSYNKKPD